MLEKMGWKKGEGLGKEGTGMKDPVRWLISYPQSQRQKKTKKKPTNPVLTFSVILSAD